MTDMTASHAAAGHPGRPFIALGFGLAVLGIVGYAVQITMHRLATPWYMPILATLGVLLGAASLRHRRTIWRVVGLLLLVLLAGAEWSFLWATRLPAYTGPVTVGRPFPLFTSTRADGAPFTPRDLEGGLNHVFVFFRGRW